MRSSMKYETASRIEKTQPSNHFKKPLKKPLYQFQMSCFNCLFLNTSHDFIGKEYKGFIHNISNSQNVKFEFIMGDSIYVSHMSCSEAQPLFCNTAWCSCVYISYINWITYKRMIFQPLFYFVWLTITKTFTNEISSYRRTFEKLQSQKHSTAAYSSNICDKLNYTVKFVFMFYFR